MPSSNSRNKTAVAVSSSVEPLLVTTARASELLSISTWEVRRLVRRGQLAYKKLSKTNWLITTASIRAFADPSAKVGR